MVPIPNNDVVGSGPKARLFGVSERDVKISLDCFFKLDFKKLKLH